MKTNKLIEQINELQSGVYLINDKVVEEIIQRLCEYGELKQLLYDLIEPLENLFEFLPTTLREDMEGALIGVEEE